MTKRERPITIRPRRGSELDRRWQEVNHNQAEMREIAHSWAEQFARVTREEDDAD